MSVLLDHLKKIPGYLWTFTALVTGLVLGGRFPEELALVAQGTGAFIRFIVLLVPILILLALSPAVATLARRGLAGRFAGSVILWYVASSVCAGLIGLTTSSLLFRVPLTAAGSGAWDEAVRMMRALGEQTGASLPLVAIFVAVLLGLVGARSDGMYGPLLKVERAITGVGEGLGYAMAPLILLFGITLGVRFGAEAGTVHYLWMTAYTAALCGIWWAVYVVGVLRFAAGRSIGPIISRYYLPTALFAAGTTSSLATLPVNVANVKKVGVRDEVADFIVPFGAIANLDASALMYVAYAPFVLTQIFGVEITWITLLMAWPAVILFTIAAPGLPAGMGTALWSATLFASIVGLEEPAQSDFIVTWIALSGGLPDMFRTATNCTGDGFTSIFFDSVFDRWFDENGARTEVELKSEKPDRAGLVGLEGEPKRIR